MDKSSGSLRSAFRYEVRLDDYLGRAWATAILAALILAAIACLKNGQLDPKYLAPPDGWQAKDPAGNLYMETWANILVNAMQAGFSLWGAVLVFLGIFRGLTAHKFVLGCFTLGGAFIGFAYFLPSSAQILLKMLIERYPVLVQ